MHSKQYAWKSSNKRKLVSAVKAVN